MNERTFIDARLDGTSKVAISKEQDDKKTLRYDLRLARLIIY